MTAKRTAITAGILLAILALAWSIFHKQSADAWVKTQAAAYQTTYENEATSFDLQWQSSGKAASPQSRKLLTQVSGLLLLQEQRKEDGREMLLLQMENASASMGVDGGQSPSRNERLEQSLAKGASFVRKADGKLESVSEPETEIDRSAIGVLAEVYAMLPQVYPTEAETKREYDLSGAYNASYRWDAEKKSLSKSGKAYVNEGLAKADLIDPLYTQGQDVEADLSMLYEGVEIGQKRFAKAQGQQITRISISKQTALLSKTRVQFAASAFPHGADRTLAGVKQKQTSVKDFLANMEVIAAPVPGWDEIESGLEAFPAHKDIRDETEFVLKVRTLLKARPEEAERIVGLLDAYSVESKEYMAILRGVLASQKAEAQKALLDFIAKKRDEGGAHVILVAHLAEFEDPSPELLSSLKSYSKDPDEELRSTSLLALGNAAAQVALRNEAAAHDLFVDLQQGLGSTQDLGEKSTFWGALGNYAGPEVWSLVRQEYASTPKELKHRLVNALRLVSGDEPQSFLLDQVQTGENEIIRLTGMNALTLRVPHEKAIEIVGNALFQEKSVNVQSVMLSYLAQHARAFPAAGEALQGFLRQHPESEATKGFIQQFGKAH